MTSIRAFTKGFCDDLDLEQHGDDFLVCGGTRSLEKLTEEFNGNFLVRKSEIVSLKPEHQSETHFLKRRISVDEFGWHVEKFVGCNGDESLQIDGYSWIEGTGGQQCDGETGCKGTSRVTIRRCNLSELIEQRFDIAFSTKEIMREAAGPTTASKTKLKRIARYLKGRQRCVLNFPWVGKLDDVIHVTVDADWAGNPKTRCSTSGGALAIGPCFTVRHWSVTQATVSLSSAESEAKAITKGCIEALYVKHLLEHQTARTFKIEVWTDSSSAKAIIQRLGPGRRAKQLEVQTMWVQQLNKLGVISMNKLGTLENVADMMTKHVPRGVLDNLAGMMGYSFSGEETAKVSGVLEYRAEFFGNRNSQRWKNCRSSMMETTKNWSVMIAALRTKRLISRQPF